MMDELIITLPCGFTSKYKEIFYNKNQFPCPFCKNHLITGQECLNMTRNKVLIKEKNFELTKKNFTDCLQSFQMSNQDPQSSIDDTYENLKNKIDLRREEVKLMIEKKIDDYYENLLEIIENEKKQKFNEFKEEFEKTLSLKQDLINLNINNVTDLNYKLNVIDNYCVEIDKGIQFLRNENKFNSNNWLLNEGDENFQVEKIFGNLEWQETTDKKNKSEADFIFLIEKFSKFINTKNSTTKSSLFKVNDLEWELIARINENTSSGKMLGFYLSCNSINDSNNKSVNVNVEFRFLNLIEKIKDIVAKIENVFDKDNYAWGFHNFLTVDEIMNQKSGFYDLEKDCVTLEIRIFSAEIYYKKTKRLIGENVFGTVKWYNVKNGYGFIARNDTDEQIFVHQSEIQGKNKHQIEKGLGEGEQVEFDVVQGEKGLEATNVTGLNGQSVQGSIFAAKKKHRRRNRKKSKKNSNFEFETENSD